MLIKCYHNAVIVIVIIIIINLSLFLHHCIKTPQTFPFFHNPVGKGSCGQMPSITEAIKYQ